MEKPPFEEEKLLDSETVNNVENFVKESDAEWDQIFGNQDSEENATSTPPITQDSSAEEVTPTPTQRPRTNAEIFQLLTTKEGLQEFSAGFSREFSSQKFNWKNPTTWDNLPSSMGAGVVDTAIGVTNLIPYVNIPRLPKYEQEGLQAVRDLSSILIPTMGLTGKLNKFGKAAHAKVGWKIGNDPLVKFIGKTGIGAGAGALVDGTAPVQERDHNALGQLKKAWPKSWGWVSDDWATLDSDGPDQKRQKNIKEGIGLGIFADVLVGAGKLAKALKGNKKALGWIPENEKAKNLLTNLKKKEELSKDPIENAILNSAKQRSDDLDETGLFNLGRSVDLDSPVKGFHDLYDYTETGYRSVDEGGIFGASVDLVRINNNIDTIHGRIGSFFTDNAIKLGLEADDAGHKFIKEQADLLSDSKYGYRLSDTKYLSFDDMNAAGEQLAADLYKMDLDEIKRTLKPLSQEDLSTGATTLTDVGYAGVFKSINKYMKDYATMDIAKAQAYTATSFAGQVSDMAQASRLVNDNPAQVAHAREQILDRLQYLMQIKATTSYTRGRALNMMNLWKRLTKGSTKLSPSEARLAVENEGSTTLEALQKIRTDSFDTIESLRNVQREKPHLLDPLILAYEHTDGNIDSITRLNTYLQNTTGVVGKAFLDNNPDMPSAWVNGMWANIYNSVLSSIGTPAKAAASNIAIMIERPIATIGGALLSGDKATAQRGMYMYTVGILDTFQKSLAHMNQVYRRAANDPGSVHYIMREDIARANKGQMQILNSYADAAEIDGNLGPRFIVNQIEEMNALAEHPWMRFSANAMTAFDGFTKAFVGSVEARGRAYDQLIKAGQPVTKAEVKKLGQGLYDQMFDANGFITDEAVEYASREIAMNLDSQAVQGLNDVIRRFPIFKPFLMFPKTSANILRFAQTHAPIQAFNGELKKFSQAWDDISLDDAKALLSERGHNVTDVTTLENTYKTIQAELRGRQAIGRLTTFAAFGLFSTDRLRGNGVYDKTRQRTRRELGWKPRTYKGLDGKWYSYENMGALTDWLALTADILDNFDVGLGSNPGTLDENDLGTLFNKAGHILSANLTNKSFTAGLEPLNDVLAGNPAALSRWGASFGSSFLPMSGMRNELGRLMSPALREVEQDLIQLIANRNIGMRDKLPVVYDWIDGSVIGEPDNFFQRVHNVYSPWWKQSGALTPEKQFLIDIEYNGRPSLKSNGKGVEYTPIERSEITSLIGQHGYFKKQLKLIMQSSDGQEFRRLYREAQKTGVPIDRKKFLNLHHRINLALRQAKKLAEATSSSRESIQQKTTINKLIESATKRGDTDLLKLINEKNR